MRSISTVEKNIHNQPKNRLKQSKILKKPNIKRTYTPLKI